MKTGKSDPLLVDFKIWLSNYGLKVAEILRGDGQHTRNGPNGEILCELCKAEGGLRKLVEMLGDQGKTPDGFRDDRCAVCGHDRLSHNIPGVMANHLLLCAECKVNRRCEGFVAIEA